VALVLVAALLVVAAAGAVNALVDPYGSVGTGIVGPAVWTDRSEKVRLIEQLQAPPRVVVLGSSRAMKVQPSYLTRITGQTAFNASVSSGRPVDAYVFTRFLHDRFPQTSQSYLWLLDQEAFAEGAIDPTLLADSTLGPYLPAAERWRDRASGLSWLFSWSTLHLSWKTWRQEQRPRQTLPQRDEQGGPAPRFAADGYRVSDANSRAAAHGRSLAAGIAQSRRIFARRYQTGYPGLAESPREFFERTVKTMNSWGATPVIVLSPMQPRLLRDLRYCGWEARHRDVLAYLSSLRSGCDFVLLDMSHIGSFKGSPRDFYDGVHMMPPNHRKLIRAVLADPAATAALDVPAFSGPTARH
jgi:hypothetical protein